MNFVICVILSCLLASYAYSLPQDTVMTSWGNVDGNSSSIVKAFVESSLFQVKNYTVNFPDPEVCTTPITIFPHENKNHQFLFLTIEEIFQLLKSN